MSEAAVRCNGGLCRAPADARHPDSGLIRDQAATGLPAVIEWLRPGTATPALRSAATRFVSSG